MNCIFCKIISGEIPSKKVFESDTVMGFYDLSPQAKTHLLFIHKNHSRDVSEMIKENASDIQEVFKSIVEFIEKENDFKDGFRVVTNQGKNAGQTVFHTHFHVLAGEPLAGFGS